MLMAQLIADRSYSAWISAPLRLLAAVLVAALLVAGVLLLGRIAPDDRDAMLLTAAWFGVVAVAGMLVAKRRRPLALPLAVGYVTVAVVVAVVLARPMFFDDVVDERVVRGAPASAAGARASNLNVELAAGEFEGVRHDGSGRAAVVRLRGGEQKLTLTDFETDNGPDLFVYLAAGNPTAEDQVTDYVDLGRLKGNKGDQQYTIPSDVDIRRYSTVVIWCRAFTVLFTRADLRPS
jgi:hypothetical protein